MQYVFIRHNLSTTTNILEQLCEEKLIALHYEDIDSVNPDDYSPGGARDAMNKLWSYCQTGAVVGASYPHRGESMMVGKIVANSKPYVRTFQDEETGESYFYKVAKLEDAVVAPYSKYWLLAGIRPRQTAITGWPSAGCVLEAALNNTAIPRTPSNLNSGQQEVLCYEWLRSFGRLDRLLMPIGRGMIDIDIVGINESGVRVIAQVTHEINKRNLDDKMVRLKRHTKQGDEGYFFLPDIALSQMDNDREIKQVSLETVLHDLESISNPATEAMLKEMFLEE